MKRFLTTSLVCSLLAVSAAAQEAAGAALGVALDPHERALLAAGDAHDGAAEIIRALTTEHPRRLTGSSGLERAELWAQERFAALGLDVRREAWGEVPVGFDRGAWSGRVLGADERALTFVTPAWTPGTDGPVRAPLRLGAASAAAARAAAEADADAWRGAWVLLPPAAAGGRERRDVESAYAELGALGLLAPGSRDGRLTMTGSWERPRREGPLDVRVLYDDYVALRDELEAGAARELELDVRNAFVDGPVTQYNVVADLVGRERPDEYVLVQGHIDAFDGAQGACDNGTGVATTLEAARLLASLDERPRRTIRFVLYSGEEQGLYGSRGYVRDHADELERVSVVLNHDNGTNYLAGIGPTLAMLADFEHVFAPVQALDPERPFALRVSPGLTPGPSDHAPFVEAGVPAFHWDQSQEGYRRLHHTQHDTLAEVDDADQRHSARVIALAAWRFAELDHLVDRTRLRRPEPRRMGVYLAREDSRVVENVVPGGLAEGAGWRVGDVIVAIDGMEVQDSKQIAAELQKGGPQKRVVLERGAERVESVLDYTDDPQEAERRAWEEEPAEAR